MERGTAIPRRPPGLLRWPSYVLGQLYRETQGSLEAALAPEALNLRSHFVLICLGEFEQISQQQVADRINMDASDLVKLLDGLEQRGLIVRERAPDDRRRHVLTLTPAGRRALGRANDGVIRATDEALSRLTRAERRTLHRLALKALGEPTAVPATSS